MYTTQKKEAYKYDKLERKGENTIASAYSIGQYCKKILVD